MGLIRKTLFLGTGGLGPNWNSNKERTRKAAEKSVRIQGQMLKQQQRAAAPVARSSSATPVGLDSPGRLARAARRDARERVGPMFSVVLTAIDPAQRAATLRAIRDVTDLSPEACERLLAQVPYVIETGVGGAEAEALRARFGDSGATVELRPQSAPPPRVAPTPPAEPSGLADELARIATLHRDGTLSDDEFAAAKAKVLGA